MKLDRRGVSQQREYPTCQYIVHFLMVNFIFLNFTFKKKVYIEYILCASTLIRLGRYDHNNLLFLSWPKHEVKAEIGR